MLLTKAYEHKPDLTTLIEKKGIFSFTDKLREIYFNSKLKGYICFKE